MYTNNIKGRNITIAISVYLIVKTALNMIISGDFSLINLIMGFFAVVPLVFGTRYMNYVLSVIIAAIVLQNIEYNLTNLPSSLIYLIESVVDMVCVVILCVQKDVREHFTSAY